MTALLSIGTELTRGDLDNTNAGFLSRALLQHHIEVTEMVTVDDDADRIVKALLDLSQRHDLLIVTGGLGPTSDDLTTACAARAAEVPLVLDSGSLAAISARFKERGLVMSSSNEKQAWFPEGATVLPNPLGTAPGFALTLQGAQLFFTPGVPAEMRAIFEQEIVPRLIPRERLLITERFHTFGLPESQVGERLADLEASFQVQLGYRASSAHIEVKVFAEVDPADRARLAQLEQLKGIIRERLGTFIYAEGDTSLKAEIQKLCASRGIRLALAESCTGGLISEWLTEQPGASEYFLGAVVSYANSAKTSLLGVEERLLREHGAVSEEVAKAMAVGAQARFLASHAIATTGIAGPSGGTPEKPVGLVHFALAGPAGVAHEHRIIRGDRRQIQSRAAMQALMMLHAELIRL